MLKKRHCEGLGLPGSLAAVALAGAVVAGTVGRAFSWPSDVIFAFFMFLGVLFLVNVSSQSTGGH